MKQIKLKERVIIVDECCACPFAGELYCAALEPYVHYVIYGLRDDCPLEDVE